MSDGIDLPLCDEGQDPRRAYLNLVRDAKYGTTLSIDLEVMGMQISVTARVMSGDKWVEVRRWSSAWWSGNGSLADQGLVLWSGLAPADLDLLGQLVRESLRLQVVRDVLET